MYCSKSRHRSHITVGTATRVFSRVIDGTEVSDLKMYMEKEFIYELTTDTCRSNEMKSHFPYFFVVNSQ